MKKLVAVLLFGIVSLGAGTAIRAGTGTAQEVVAPAAAAAVVLAGTDTDGFVCGVAGCTNTYTHNHVVCPAQACGETAVHQHEGAYYMGHHSEDGHLYCGGGTGTCTVAGCTQAGSHTHGGTSGHRGGGSGSGHGGNHH